MRTLLAAVTLALAAATPGLAREWTVDPATSRLAVTFSQAGKPVEARFERYDAKIRFDRTALDQAEIVVTVDLASFASGDGTVDGQVASPEFFDVANHATATYRTTALRALGEDRYAVTAELELKGVTRTLEHEAIIEVDGDLASASGTVPLLRLDYGLGATQFADGGTVGLEVVVTFEVQATGD